MVYIINGLFFHIKSKIPDLRNMQYEIKYSVLGQTTPYWTHRFNMEFIDAGDCSISNRAALKHNRLRGIV